MGKGNFRLDFLSRCNRHAEQHLQHIVCGKMLSGQIQGVLHLGQYLILPQDLGLKAAGEIKQMLHRLPAFPFGKIRFIVPSFHPPHLTEALIQRVFHAFLSADPQFHPVAGGKNHAAGNSFFFLQLFHSLPGIFFRKRKQRPDIHRGHIMVNSNHGNIHDSFFSFAMISE